ncbi:hypothetical protein [Sphingomonas sp.]|uniref:hypothetical protein n=1 Tax=Sphingomonas sp. TaxID=28214 RepID=UPI001B08F820|nr:hypothetical protein [Sphingomonas sp.]MBO9714802.1 hypothetical protein [Sphingomonas sp.]
MIGPLSQSPPAPVSGESPVAPAVEAGEDFAALLAAGSSPPAGGVPLPGSGTPELPAALTDAPQLQPVVADPRQRAAARSFNRDGFFEPGQALSAALVVSRVQPVAAPEIDLAGAAAAIAAPEDGPAATRPSAAPLAGSTLAASGSRASPEPARGLATRLVLAPPFVVSQPRIVAGHPVDPGAPLQQRARPRSAAAEQSVQVAVHELERGLHVAAFAGSLGEGQAERLHVEIAALLSRHGLAARSIRIHGPRASSTIEEEAK